MPYGADDVSPSPRPEAEGYEAAWAELRSEIVTQQQVVAALRRRLDELAPDRRQPESDAAEVEQLQKEVLRLRDAVIGKDAELGQALGRNAELEARLARCAPAQERLDAILASRSWRVMWALGRPLRARRNRA